MIVPVSYNVSHVVDIEWRRVGGQHKTIQCYESNCIASDFFPFVRWRWGGGGSTAIFPSVYVIEYAVLIVV